MKPDQLGTGECFGKIILKTINQACMGRFILVLKGQKELITEFDESLWSGLTEKIVVKSKEEVKVVFKDGTEITVE